MVKDQESGEFYVVSATVVPHLAGDVQVFTLVPAIDRHGNVFLWPLRQPNADRRSDTWAESALKAAESAKTSWIRVQANMRAGSYDVGRALGNLPEPEWPRMSFEAMLELAFRGRVIDSTDHPLARRLLGAS